MCVLKERKHILKQKKRKEAYALKYKVLGYLVGKANCWETNSLQNFLFQNAIH